MPPKVSAYFTFCAEKREETQKRLVEERGEKVAVSETAKALGALWKALSDAEKDHYRQLAAQRAAEAEAEAGPQEEQENQDPQDNVPAEPQHELLPLSVVRRVIALDKDIGRVSKDAVTSIAYATELFMHLLADKCAEIARKGKRCTLKVDDLELAVKAEKRLGRTMGLKEVVAFNLARRNEEAQARAQAREAAAAEEGPGAAGDDDAAEAGPGSDAEAAAGQAGPSQAARKRGSKAPGKRSPGRPPGGAGGGKPPAAKKAKAAAPPVQTTTLHKFFAAVPKPAPAPAPPTP